ncbi:MAG: hypothetical protein GX660_03175 [Clostridiaceae bacterium]|nr:hypothetical protein [Clostridiaceae bacterium]
MASSNKIGFAGTKVNDIALYLSRILVNLGRNTAIIDASKEQLLKYSVPEINKGDIVTYRNVDVFLNCIDTESFSDIDMTAYDVVMINFGMNDGLIEEYSGCNVLMAVTDLQRHNILRLRDFLSKTDKNLEIIRVFRDVVDCKIDKKYIDSILESFGIKYLADYELYLEDAELVCRIESQYNDIIKFQKLQKEYKNMLREIVLKYLGIEGKLLTGAFKTAEKGR